VVDKVLTELCLVVLGPLLALVLLFEFIKFLLS